MPPPSTPSATTAATSSHEPISSSPHRSSASPQQRRDSARERLDSDANIHNFAPVARIMKSALPENAKIAKEAKECMQECVSEFISFITSEGKSITTSQIILLTRYSFREVSTREAKDSQWRRHSLRHDIARL